VNLELIARILHYRARLRGHETWSRDELRRHQEQELAQLRGFACEHSPFYARFHRGLQTRPLEELPVLTKARLMDSFDEVVTDRRLQLAGIEEHLRSLQGDEVFQGGYWISATSGSSGRRSIIPSNLTEWARIIASYGRANEWSGLRISPFRHTRIGVVSSRTPYHQSLRVGRSIQMPLVQTCRLDAAQPLAEILRALDEFRPDVLVAYASMLRVLAEEQLAGRLHVAPRSVHCSSEVMTPEARERVSRAWGRSPFEVYAATETGGIAAECERHGGMHLFEDLVIPEVVDDEYRPVAAGVAGSRLLVTVLFSRTLPLIRYELTDRVRLASEDCACGRPFRLVAEIEGRTDDVLELPASGGGKVRLHPIVFHRILDLVNASAWQIRQQREGLLVLVQAPEVEIDTESIERSIAAAVMAAGAVPGSVRVDKVAEIPPGASGKRPFVVALKGDTDSVADSVVRGRTS
jgi:putative adenylate-forming enzyme